MYLRNFSFGEAFSRKMCFCVEKKFFIDRQSFFWIYSKLFLLFVNFFCQTKNLLQETYKVEKKLHESKRQLAHKKVEQTKSQVKYSLTIACFCHWRNQGSGLRRTVLPLLEGLRAVFFNLL